MFLDADIAHAFWPNIELAKRQAMLEAVNTGGLILAVYSIELKGSSLIFVGTLPVDALEMEPGAAGGRPRIRSSGFGTFHTTWGDLIWPSGLVGFFVLRQPVMLIGAGPPGERTTVRVAMEVKRRFVSRPHGFVGSICCTECNVAISEERLRAMPRVRTCTNCQRIKEENRKWTTSVTN